MTHTQLIWGWGLYGAGVLACLIALWMITGKIPTRIRRMIRTGAAVMLLTPWWHSPDVNLLIPAFWVMIYDGLSNGFPAMARPGLPLLAATSIGSIVALMLPVSDKTKNPKAKSADKSHNKRSERQEPTV